MTEEIPDLLRGTESCLVAEVPGAGTRWKQAHFNKDIVRRFFGIEPGPAHSITLERISAEGRVAEREIRRLVFSQKNRNYKIEISFADVTEYPSGPNRPLLVIVESGYLTFRYRTLMPGESGYDGVLRLLAAGPSIGRGLRRRIVTLDELETYWPEAALRGGI